MTACRSSVRLVAVLTALLVTGAAPARAADALFGATLGYFAVKAEDARVSGDVLVENLGYLTFEPGDFNGATFGGEFLISLGSLAEAGVGVAYYQRTAPSIYTDFVNEDFSEIEQDLKLRIVPVEFTLRLFPIGRDGAVQPYIGGGLAILAWRYSETGEFVDFNAGNQVYRDSYVDQGNEPAPVVLGGIRFPVGASVLIGGEFRWHGGSAGLDPDLGFAGDRIDLGGYRTQVVVQFRF